MELKDTVELMNSSEYKLRFKAEYYQLKVRYEKLSSMIEKYEQGTLSFKPKCSIELLNHQLKVMNDYLMILKARSEVEGINL